MPAAANVEILLATASLYSVHFVLVECETFLCEDKTIDVKRKLVWADKFRLERLLVCLF